MLVKSSSGSKMKASDAAMRAHGLGQRVRYLLVNISGQDNRQTLVQGEEWK